ncbi:MAG TPA: hypothetical protein VE398_23960 [Acidobacteriota bacterium]|nr:hypothetical protein [Acidobacteriota bacterium]
MNQIVLNGKEIEIEGFPWKIVERDRINMGTYLVLDIEVNGSCTRELTLRIKHESMQTSPGEDWILDAIRAALQGQPDSRRTNLWL